MAGGRNKSGAQKKKKAAARPTAGQLLQQAQIAIQYDDYESALDALRRAYKLEPNNIEVLEAYGPLLAEMGDEEEATTVLQHAVQLSPESGHEKYLYLGQLLEGEAALEATKRGIAVLQHELDSRVGSLGPSGNPVAHDNDEDMDADHDEDEGRPATIPELQAQLCSAMCSLAEMMMGQADCDSSATGGAAAESSGLAAVSLEVEQLLARAQATCSSSPEPGQALASLRYEQGRAEEALAVLRQSMKLWFKDVPSEEDEDEEMEEGIEERVEQGASEVKAQPFEDDDAIQPSYEFRFECAKLLLELDDTTELAIQVLEDLVEEDDSNPHTWHLLGMAYYGGQMLEEAQEIYEKGMKLLKKMGLPESDEIYEDFEDLKGAIEDASKVAAEDS